MKRERRLSIGTALLLMNLAALVLPVSGLWVLRLYESALIRQTESELIAQGAVIAAAYRGAWVAAGGKLDRTVPPVDPRWTRRPGFDAPWLPRPASLDLARDEVLPAPPDPDPATQPPDPAARRAGEGLDAMLREAQRVTLAGMRVVDRHGVVVASTGEAVGSSLASREEVRRALSGEPVSVLRLRGNGPAQSTVAFDRGRTLRVFCALPVMEDDRVIGAVLLARTPRTISEALAGKRRHLAVLAVLLLGSVGALAALGATAIGTPLRAVTLRAKQVADGQRGAMEPLARPMVREVAELSEALTRMATTLEQRADYIRDFAAHVSHEFKTPLTTIRGTVELMREHLAEMSDEERDRFLANMDSEAERLSRLVARLLELGRADVKGSTDEGPCHPLAVARQVAERSRTTGLQVEVSGPDDLAAAISEDALASVLSNLLDNARQHGGSMVRISLRRDGGRAVLTVRDDGPGISPANSERIFTPFFTTARKRGGTGLGLAIVHSLVAAHGGTIALVPSERGAAFEIGLPSITGEAPATAGN